MQDIDARSKRAPALRRVLTFWPVVLYGLAVIVGAGIYVAIGAVVGRAGDAAPFSFLLAGLSAGVTGLCYAELAARFPEASGGVAYIRHGFGSDRLAQLAGVAITISVAISAASIAGGAVHYLVVLLPLPIPLLISIVVVGFTAVSVLGVRESVGAAAAMGIVEIAGLLAATVAGFLQAPNLDLTSMWPADAAAGRGVFAGAFIAFFAFTGFESLANLAEEVKDPMRTVPRGIMAAVAASLILYIAVASAAVLGDSAADSPLLGLFTGKSATAFAAIGTIAVANGVMVQIIMLARLFYGMARRGQLPSGLARIDPTTRTPVRATILAGIIVLAAALLVPFERLLVLTNALTLVVFLLVALALWNVQRRQRPVAGQFAAPRWVPPCAAALSLILLMSEFLI